MKRTLIATVFAVLISAYGFANPVDGEKKEVNASSSTLTWKGYKVTGSHTGTIGIQSGHLEFDGDKLIGGEFVVNMTSLVSTDLSGGGKAKLEGHLKSDDFFGVEKFPTAKLVFKKVKADGKNAYEVTGDLTIKGITKSVTFEVAVFGSKATADLTIDRSKFDVRYGSGSFFDNLGDKTIYDDFKIVADLEF